jgi:hypothetical protein
MVRPPVLKNGLLTRMLQSVSLISISLEVEYACWVSGLVPDHIILVQTGTGQSSDGLVRTKFGACVLRERVYLSYSISGSFWSNTDWLDIIIYGLTIDFHIHYWTSLAEISINQETLTCFLCVALPLKVQRSPHNWKQDKYKEYNHRTRSYSVGLLICAFRLNCFWNGKDTACCPWFIDWDLRLPSGITNYLWQLQLIKKTLVT